MILALVGEVGELAELFQWLPAAGARSLAGAEPLRTRAAEEMADVLLYLVLLADVLGIDLGAAASSKLADAERRFPVDEVAGRAPGSARAPGSGRAPGSARAPGSGRAPGVSG